jgi:hypothetical protein
MASDGLCSMAALKSAIARSRSPLVDPGVAAIVVGQREGRVNADGFVVVGYRTIEIALEGVDAAAVGERTGRGRIEPDRLVEIGKRGVVLSGRARGSSTQPQACCRFRVWHR